MERSFTGLAPLRTHYPCCTTGWLRLATAPLHAWSCSRNSSNSSPEAEAAFTKHFGRLSYMSPSSDILHADYTSAHITTVRFPSRLVSVEIEQMLRFCAESPFPGIGWFRHSARPLEADSKGTDRPKPKEVRAKPELRADRVSSDGTHVEA